VSVASPPRRILLRRVLPWVLLAAGLVVFVLVVGPGGRDYLPLDPRSTKPDGTKAMMDVLRELGARVDVVAATPPAGADTALVLSDQLTDAGRAQLLDWVRDGGTLVVADPESPISDPGSAGQTDLGFLSPPLDRHCPEPALADVGRVEAAGGRLFEVPAGATGCFTRDDPKAAWLLIQPTGQGTLVRVGGAGAFTNASLGKHDNGLLAVALLAPTAGTRVAVYPVTPFEYGPNPERERSLSDLIAPGVKAALWQLAVAFGFVALWRGRRLGKPVLEPTPVEIPGSELVLAVGNLLQRARLRGQAATALADDLRRTLAERLGVPLAMPVEQLADLAAARSGVPRERVLAALTAAPADEAGLVAAAQTVEAVRREVARGGRRPAAAAQAGGIVIRS
jgi:hypothetical protein